MRRNAGKRVFYPSLSSLRKGFKNSDTPCWASGDSKFYDLTCSRHGYSDSSKMQIRPERESGNIAVERTNH
ncbi:unnamed protein product [Leptosia nina]|uniref:Uncharacterized protein n=1 Tax=Leptosia nina TaxID=320188 RepID=A0AAV1IVV5_9NEOP